MNRLLSLLIGVAILAGGAPLQAHATAFFATGNSPQQPGQENVLYTSTQTGTSIQGFLNQSNTAVSFTSGQTLQVTALGQANLTTIDNVINSVTIAIPGQTYDSIIFNPFVGQTGGGGTTTVTVLTNTGSQIFEYSLGNGNNFVTITTDALQSIFSTTITSDGGFADLRQVRIAGAQAVPVPSTLLLFGIGFAGLTAWRALAERPGD